MKKLIFIAGVFVGALIAGYVWRADKPVRVPAPTQEHAPKPAAAQVDATRRDAPPAKEAPAVKPSSSVQRAQNEPAPKESSPEYNAVRDNLRLQEVLPELTAPPGDWRTFAPAKLTVSLLPGLAIEFEAQRITTGPQRTIWVGDNGTQGVTLVASGTRDRWDAIVTIPGALEYSIEVSPAGVRIVEKDFGEEICGTTSLVERDSAFLQDQPAQEAPPLQTAADTAPLTSDLLILYTAAVKQAVGGAEAVQNLFATQIATANTYLSQSEVDVIQWQLVGTVEAPAFPRTGNLEDDLVRLADRGTELGSFASQQRDLFGADQVMLVVENSNDNTIGIAFLAPGSFSVIIQSVSAASVAHELAHNFGCRHDRQQVEIEEGLQAGALDNDGRYFYGHRYNDLLGRDTGTIMSYATSRRVTFFSNPNITFEGHPLGVPAGEPRAADNARLLRENAQSVSNRRPAGGQTPPVITSQPASVTVTAGQPFSLSITATGGGLTYQWAHDGAPIPGATGSSYTKNNSTTTDSGSYTVRVSNSVGSVQSNTAVVTVNPPVEASTPSTTPASSGGGGAFDGFIVLALFMTLVGSSLARPTATSGELAGESEGSCRSLLASDENRSGAASRAGELRNGKPFRYEIACKQAPTNPTCPRSGQ